jgi:hypothetical protein
MIREFHNELLSPSPDIYNVDCAYHRDSSGRLGHMHHHRTLQKIEERRIENKLEEN